MPRISFTKAKTILVSLILYFLLPFIAYAFDQAKVYPLGEAIIEAINNPAQKGIRPSEAQLLLLTADLKWYEQNMSRLPEQVQDMVTRLRLKLAKRSVDIAANAIVDSTAMFGAIGSWNPGRDMDVIYFGKKTDKARQSLINAFESAIQEILEDGLKNDELLKALKAKGLQIPESISAKTMSFGMLELPDFGYGKLENAFKKIVEAKKTGDSIENITKALKDDVTEAMLSNFEAHIATTASEDFYRGVSGQECLSSSGL